MSGVIKGIFIFLIISICLINLVQAQTENLQLYLPFSGNADDASGNNNNGIVNGAVLTTDKNGNADSAYYFDGVDDYINLGTGSFNIQTSEYTISLWAKPSSLSGTKTLIARGVLHPFSLSTSGNKIYASTRTSTTKDYSTGNINLQLDNWNHVVYSFKDGELKVYVNGVLDISKSVSGTASFSFAKETDIGKIPAATTNLFSGSIDELRIYNRALADEEVLNLYNPLPPQCIDNDIDGWNSTAICNDGIHYDCMDVYIDNPYSPNVNPGVIETYDLCSNGYDEDCNNGDLICNICTFDDNNPISQRCLCENILRGIGDISYCCADGTYSSIPCSERDFCIDNDFDGWNSTAICNDGINYDCSDNNRYIFPGTLNANCDCDNSDGYSQGKVEICGNEIDEDCNGKDSVCNNNIIVGGYEVDHDFYNITDECLDTLRTKRILLGTRSWGLNTVKGLKSLANRDPRYNLTIEQYRTDAPSSQIIPEDTFNNPKLVQFVFDYSPTALRWRVFNDYVRNNSNEIDFAFEYLYSSNLADAKNMYYGYSSVFDSLRNDYPNINFAFVTHHVDTATIPSSGWNIHSKWYTDMVYENYSGVVPILDIRDIVSTRANSEICQFEYNSTTYRNLCPEYNIVGGDGIHPNTAEAQERLAKGVFVLLSKVYCETSIQNQTLECTSDLNCSDGLYCNGQETCFNGMCVAGTSPIVNDNISCTQDICDEINDTILNIPNNNLCEDNNSCTDDLCIGLGGDSNGCNNLADDTNICTIIGECVSNSVCSNGVCIANINLSLCPNPLSCLVVTFNPFNYACEYSGCPIINITTNPNQKLNLDEYMSPTSTPRFELTDITWPDNYGDAEVTLWEDDKLAAVSLGIDDNIFWQVDWWINQTQLYGWKMTWWVIVSYIEKNDSPSTWGTWEDWRNVYSQGYDVESHTMTHGHCMDNCPLENPCDCCNLTYEYEESQRLIKENIPGNLALTMAPGGGDFYHLCGHDFNLSAEYYISTRGQASRPNIPNKIYYTNADSMSLSNNTIEWVDKLLDPNTQHYYRGWLVMFTHYKPDLSEPKMLLDHLKEKENNIWVGLYNDVAMYGQERDTHNLTITYLNDSEIRFDLKDEMNDTYFTYPLTIKIKLNNEWENMSAVQNEQNIEFKIVENNSNKYALVKAVPDKGEVILTKTELIEECFQDSDCDNTLFCDGIETCLNNVCQQGTPVSCQSNNIIGINTCNNDPDNNPFTLDYLQEFTSQCSEPGICTVQNETLTLTNTCDKTQCNAECDINNLCSNTNCGSDGCVGNDYYDYTNVANICTSSCTCTNNQCSLPIISYNDTRCTTPQPTNLQLYLPFSGNADDASGNNNNGIVNGAVLTTDKNGNADSAYYFDGVDDYIDAGMSNFNLSSEITISAWINPSEVTGTKSIISRGRYVYPFSYSISSSKLTAQIRNVTKSSTLSAANNLAVNQWYHVVITYKNGERIIYTNGTKNREDGLTGNLYYLSGASCTSKPYDCKTLIGAMPLTTGASNYFKGTIDELRIYNRALTDEEVLNLYNL